MSVAAVVLCGGRGRRMGTDKALLEWEGVPLYEFVARRLQKHFEPVVLAPGIPGRLGTTGYSEIADDPEGVGPLGGICAALATAPTPVVAVVAADMPRCDPELLARFLDLMGEHDAVIPETSGGLQPLHAVYAVSALPVLSREALAGRLSVVSACHLLDARIVGASELIGLGGMPDLDTNLNIPDDLYD